MALKKKKVTKAAPAKGAPEFTAYNVVTKEKGCPVLEPEICRIKTKRGYVHMAKGVDKKGNKLSAMISGDNANLAVKAGLTKGQWDK